MLIAVNGYAFTSLSTIPKKAQSYYDEPETIANLFTEAFYVIYLPLSPLASWLLTKSLHKSLLLSWVCTFIGGWVKYIASTNFWAALAGQVILSAPTCIILTAISTLAATWFPKNQQLCATVIGELCTFLGMGVSFVVAPSISIDSNNLGQAAIITTVFATFLVLGKKDPVQTEALKLRGFCIEIKNCLKDPVHCFMVVTTGAVTGVGYSFLGLLGESLETEDLHARQAGYIGFLMTICGLLGGIFSALLEVKGVSLLKSIPVFQSLALGILMVWCILGSDLIAGYILGGLLGFHYFASLPLCLRLSVIYNREVSESISSGIVFFTAQVFGFIFSYPIEFSNKEVGIKSLWTVFTFLVIGSALMFIIICRLSSQKPRNELAVNLKEDSCVAGDMISNEVNLTG